MKNCTHEEKLFLHINRAAPKGETVFLGSTLFYGTPFGELTRNCGLNCGIHNRSIKGLQLTDAEAHFEQTVLPLEPKTVFLNLGEVEASAEHFDEKAFRSVFEHLLFFISRKTDAEINIVSIIGSSQNIDAANRVLVSLCMDLGYRYIDVNNTTREVCPELHLFDVIRPYLRKWKMSFADAMAFRPCTG